MVTKKIFGNDKNGNIVTSYNIAKGDLTVEVLDRGATIRSVLFKGTDVVLGYDDVAGYEQSDGYLGATIGRYGNRIKAGRFALGGKEYDVGKNENNKNHLHGGFVGYDKLMWQEGKVEDDAVTLTLTDDGAQSGYPGVLSVSVRFSIEEDALIIEYSARSTEDTPFNPTNHTYFNLGGVGSGDILDTSLQINATRFLPIDDELIPTGVLRKVAGTPFDFTAPKSIGKEIGANDKQLALGAGYDHCFCLDGEGLRPVVHAFSPKSGITMACFTTEPAVQLYTGNCLGTDCGKAAYGKAEGYDKREAFCLETQHYPDSPNQGAFPSTLLRAGEAFYSKTAYAFMKEDN